MTSLRQLSRPLVMAVTVAALAAWPAMAGAGSTNPVVAWSPSSLSLTVAAGGSTSVPVTLTASKGLSNVKIAAVPAVTAFVTPSPSSFASVVAGTHYAVTLAVSVPASTTPGDYAGAIQVSAAGKNQPRPLSVTIHVTGAASRHLYWTSNVVHDIGRADVDGQNVNASFIANANAWGLAVDSSYVYWSSCVSPCGQGDGVIGRANLDGTSPNQSFITGICDPRGVAVDASHVYWADFFFCQAIGRADLNGQNATDGFITLPAGLSDPLPIVVAADSTYLYWTNSGLRTIGRAKLDGTSVDQSFITLANPPEGLAVDSSHIYWAEDGGTDKDSIGRANLDGTGANDSFIALSEPTADATDPAGVAVDSGHVYWTQYAGGSSGTGSIGRANLDGTSPDQSFITGLTGPVEVAVDAG